LAAVYGTGVLESVLNVYLAGLPGSTTLLNRLHAFFGVGALIGPALAAWIVGFTTWTVVCLVLTVACVPLAIGFALFYPGSPGQAGQPAAEPAEAGPVAGNAAAGNAAGLGPRPAVAPAPEASPPARGGLLGAALRDRGVLAGAAMLAVYVGVELGVGNWAFSYLVQGRGLSQSLAGYAVSGYWLGLTAGRFLISPVATRLGLTTSGLMYCCLSGIAAAMTLTWLAPTRGTAGAALVLLGFFLGPVFPTTMA